MLFRLLVAIALRWGLSPNDLKLITAVFVFAALVMPNLARRMKTRLADCSGGGLMPMLRYQSNLEDVQSRHFKRGAGALGRFARRCKRVRF